METLGNSAQDITPIFISVDPERDTPERLRDYMTSFHSSFVALTGTQEEVKQAENAFHVYTEKQPAAEDKKEYTVNHSGYIYVLDREGAYIHHFSANADATEIADFMTRQLASEFKEQ